MLSPSSALSRSLPRGVRLIFSSYDSPGNPFYGGGGAQAIHELATRLAPRHDITVLTAAHPHRRTGAEEAVRYLAVGPPGASPRLGQLLFHFSLPLRVRRLPFDVWGESLTPPFSTACLQLFTRRPVVALTQVLAGSAMRRKYRLPFDRAERFGLRTYRWAVATSSHLRERLLAANPKLRVAVIPNGVAGTLIRQDPPHSDRHILFLGRLDIEQKGLDLLLDALVFVARSLPFPVVIAGAGVPGAEAWLQRRIRELGLAGQVELVGRVEGPAKARLLEAAALLAMPSRFEASPLVMLEAFCYGVPVVQFAIPELADTPDEVGVKAPPFDTRAYGAALLELARAGGRRAAMGRAARRYVRAFDWDDLARQYEEFFAACGRAATPGGRPQTT